VCSEQLGIDLDTEGIDFLNSKKSDFPHSSMTYFDMNNLGKLDFQPEVIIF
jgi:hypothetical protein